MNIHNSAHDLLNALKMMVTTHTCSNQSSELLERRIENCKIYNIDAGHLLALLNARNIIKKVEEESDTVEPHFSQEFTSCGNCGQAYPGNGCACDDALWNSMGNDNEKKDE